MTIRNRFGQEFGVGSIVGWGHRSGNMSAEQVGVVLELRPYDAVRWNSDTREQEPVVRHKAKCTWIDGREYTSTTEAESLFVLEPHTLSHELQNKANEIGLKLQSS
ncbi:hypothetical protein KHO57_gp044 [Mycobacterium phage Phabba]|uniref:Uncharacterized protein n=1 Tax=Mycobacterium phage Phabba TaxID=2027899 RepID=A0A249XSA7_9CAUD|nr:hypothetical protein KHO57_gp044 [Mycobacterium phage Phabba]ASZ74619.1 hypothetical protein SEA_PHABBA_44 [Mycobacterium phage Phabba]